MLDRAGMHVGWWYFAIRHAVLITNMVLLEAVEEASAKATGKRGTDHGMGSTFRSAATVRPILAWALPMPCFSVLFTDGRTVYAMAHGLHVVPDAYPLAVKIRNNATFGYIEDINDENEEEDQRCENTTRYRDGSIG
jgi:hypothetical protein